MGYSYKDACTLRPSGDSDAALKSIYGDPKGQVYRADPNQRGWFIPDEKWKTENLLKIPIEQLPGFPLYGGNQKISGVTLHKIVVPAFLQAWNEIYHRGLSGKLRTFGGSFAPRHMLHDSRKPISAHAYGCALDFDVPWNGYGIPFNQMQINRDVIKIFEEVGFEWGGRWNPTDGMHIQWTDPLRGVTQASWRDSTLKSLTAPQPPKGVILPTKPGVIAAPNGASNAPAIITVKAKDLSGKEVTVKDKKFKYNGTIFTVENDSLTIKLERE